VYVNGNEEKIRRLINNLRKPDFNPNAGCDKLEAMKFTRDLGKAFAAAGRKMLDYKIPRDAASISYFGLVALFPAILVLIGLADEFLGRMNLRGIVVQTAIDLFPFPGSRQFLSTNLRDLTNPSTTVVLSCAVVVLWSSSLIFTFIEGSINRAWGVPNQKSFWESRLRSFSFMVLGGASLLISSISTVIVTAMSTRATARIPASPKASNFIGWFWSLVLIGTGLLIAVLVFTLVYKITPHCKVLWKEAISGAIATTIMWEIGAFIFVKLVQFFDYQKVYGRMGAVILVLTWVYTSSLIMLFGANLSAQLHAVALGQTIAEPDALLDDNISLFPSRHNRR
jgi:membrane protein